MNENELKNEDTVIEETITEDTVTEETVAEDFATEEANKGITLPLIWHAEDKEELLDSTFNHSTETVRKDTRMDWLLTAIGVFAIVCFGIMLYQCIRYNSFALMNYICFVCYAIIAVLFIPKPMQCFLSKMGWRTNLSKFAATSDKNGDVTLHDEKAEFTIGKKTVSVSYKYMEAIFETVNYFVLMVESKRILTFAKADLSDEQIDGVRKILADYLAEEKACEESTDNDDTVQAEDVEATVEDISITDTEVEE